MRYDVLLVKYYILYIIFQKNSDFSLNMNIQYEYTISLYIYIFLTIVNKKIIIYNNKDIF